MRPKPKMANLHDHIPSLHKRPHNANEPPIHPTKTNVTFHNIKIINGSHQCFVVHHNWYIVLEASTIPYIKSTV